MIITSSANEQIKSIRKLRERKYRTESGTYYIEGIRIVLEALAQPKRVKTLLYAPELMESQLAAEAVQKAAAAGVKLLEVNASVFETFSLKEGPMGLAAVVQQSWQSLEGVQPQQMGLWVALDSVADPGNLGTIMRTADAVGASGIFLLDHCTDPYDPAAIRASMGAIFSLQLVKLPSSSFLEWKQTNQVVAIGTSDAAKQDYEAVQYPHNLVLLMGSERQGLQPALMQACDQMVSLPMNGKSDSLNLAVATGVMLYQINSQHRKAKPK
ncbi:MAG: RNA methyltransferase [Anaerolineaceae bacterium]|nr:RNA methyltransferase [Anaerolineaceae bacterium]